MATTIWFCSVCGAANENALAYCFACGQKKEGEAQASDLQDHSSLLQERYQIGQSVGTGGFSAVYRAVDTQAHGRVVAIKQINLQGLGTEESIDATDTFNREAALLAELHHPQIPAMYDHFGDRDHWYLVLEFIAGETLEHYLETRLAQGKMLLLEEILNIGTQLCAVLNYLHTCRPPVIFRDLKPGNIMRIPTGKLYLIDFGIARRYRPGQAHDTQRLGSPGYAAPEQYGRAQTTPQADIYSLGALLHQLLTGEDPSSRLKGVAPQALGHEAQRLGLEKLIRRMLDPDPTGRPASVRIVEQDLNQARRIATSQAERIWTPPVPQIYTPSASQQQTQMQIQHPVAKKRLHTRRKVLIGLGVSLGLAGLIGGGASVWISATSHGPGIYTGHKDTVTSLAWSPDSLQVASASMDGTMRTWLISNGDNISTYDGGDGPITAITWSTQDERQLALGFLSGIVQVTSVQNGVRFVPLFYKQHDLEITSLAWSPDGTLVASGSLDRTARVWKASTGDTQTIYTGHSDAVTGITWASNILQAITSSSRDGTVQVWRDDTGASVEPPYQGHSGALNGIAWSPGSLYLAAANANQTVLVWDADHQSIPVLVLQGHSDVVNAVAWSPNPTTNYVASASDDGSVLVWNVQDGSVIFEYTLHTAAVKTVAWSPDGQWIASGSADKTVRVWQAPQP